MSKCCKFSDIQDISDEKHYDVANYEQAKRSICEIMKASNELVSELGITITMNEEGDWHNEEFIEGDSSSVEYPFDEYRAEGREPEGTVHFHPMMDTEKNYLPSIGDIFASAKYARARTGEFGCGVVNHKGIGTFSIVSAEAYDDSGFNELIDRYNRAMDDNDRAEVLKLEEKAMKYLTSNGLIKLYRWRC